MRGGGVANRFSVKNWIPHSISRKKYVCILTPIPHEGRELANIIPNYFLYIEPSTPTCTPMKVGVGKHDSPLKIWRFYSILAIKI